MNQHKKLEIDGKTFLIILKITSLLIIISDQFVKRFLVDYLTGFSLITKTCNTGAAFSIFRDNTTFLIGISIIILGILSYVFFKEKDRKIRLFLTFIMSGAIGNLIDRIKDGCVIDFIDLKIWPIFNIADSFITVGVALLVLYLVKIEFIDKNDKKEKE